MGNRWRNLLKAIDPEQHVTETIGKMDSSGVIPLSYPDDFFPVQDTLPDFNMTMAMPIIEANLVGSIDDALFGPGSQQMSEIGKEAAKYIEWKFIKVVSEDKDE